MKKKTVWILRDRSNLGTTSDDIVYVFYNKPNKKDLLDVLLEDGFRRRITNELLELVDSLHRVVESRHMSLHNYFDFDSSNSYGIHYYTMFVNE